jgi:nucleotide-binding universal stress UspA family protein
MVALDGSGKDGRAIAVATVRSRGARKVDVSVMHAPDPAAAIVASVRESFPDAFVMSTRGASGLGRLLLGSVAEGVVRRSELPVMLLTPRVLAGQ